LIVDCFAVSDLSVRYATSLDATNVEAVAACFTPRLHAGNANRRDLSGRRDIRRFAGDTARCKTERGGQFRHVPSNMRFDVDGDRGRIYFLA
jgi:hypothetical protein